MKFWISNWKNAHISLLKIKQKIENLDHLHCLDLIQTLFHYVWLKRNDSLDLWGVLISEAGVLVIRSIRSQMICKIGAVKNFAIFAEKHLCWSLSLTKLQAFIKKRLPTQVFSCRHCKTFKNNFFMENLRWLLLHCFPCSIQQPNSALQYFIRN